MGIIQGMMGMATSSDINEARQEFDAMLVRDEEILHAYKWVRDKAIFTTHRIIHVDVQGLTGKKRAL